MIVYEVKDLPTNDLKKYYEAIGQELTKRKQEEKDSYIIKLKDLIQDIINEGYDIYINDENIDYDCNIELI